MHSNWTAWKAILPATLLALGCSQADEASPPEAASPEAASAEYVLSEEPADATGVIDARKTAEDGQLVAVVGRVGGAEEPFVEGAAAFLIADESLKPCDDGCPSPWDYCCLAGLAESRAMVKIVDDAGQIVEGDAKQLLAVKELQTVVVRGRAKRDDDGNLTILATGVYVRPTG
ncbi:MAG: hypothetical protein ACYTG0_20600 [Planctomycetota bacterium]|jgi:hypothetical protein